MNEASFLVLHKLFLDAFQKTSFHTQFFLTTYLWHCLFFIKVKKNTNIKKHVFPFQLGSEHNF